MLHEVRPDTVKSWSAGRNRAPDGVIADLRELAGKIDRVASQALAMLDTAPPGAKIEIGFPVDDHEAQTLGFPCVGAWRAMAGQVVANSDRTLVLVPRGSTAGSAAAIDAHGL